MAHPLAGRPVPKEQHIDVDALLRAFRERLPDPDDPRELVAFGTSGHRGTALQGSFNEEHIAAIAQAICEYRRERGIAGPLFLGKDTHALSAPAEEVALEVFAANDVVVVLQARGASAAEGTPYGGSTTGLTATPVLSHAILSHNARLGANPGSARADGVVITPSHNPPADGGFKYNPPNGGPADSDVTGWIQDRANAHLRSNNQAVKRIPFARARTAATTREADLVGAYVADLESAIDLESIRAAGLRLGVDPLGGAALPCWAPIAERYKLDLTVVNPVIDPTFGFMTLDHDGNVRMDCSSPYAMAGLVGLKDQYDIAWGNDPDADRHGIVTRSVGLMNPNHYLAVAIRYLLRHRPQWPQGAYVGKTLVSSSLIDRVVAEERRTLREVPVGFKWFAPGLFDGTCCFGGEESAGASFLRRDGSVWTTDKDGILLGLLAAEITAKTGRDPGEHYRELTGRFGAPLYTRVDAPASPEQKKALARLTPESVRSTELAGEPITAKLTRAPGNDAPIGGLKVTAANGWFAARPSGTENVYKIYTESFRDEAHLRTILEEAQAMVDQAIG